MERIKAQKDVGVWDIDLALCEALSRSSWEQHSVDIALVGIRTVLAKTARRGLLYTRA
jgi:hypothetical protein